MINLDKLSRFLSEANKNTYAGDGEKINSSRLGSYDLEFKNGDWIYHDTYFGNETFMGEEIVYFKEIPVWGANYYGGILDSSFSSEEVYGFLKKALLENSLNLILVRGPENFKENDFEYKNSIQGNLENFMGKEEIYISGKKAYEAVYHGGLIKGKE